MVLPLVLLALHSSIALAQWVPSTNCPKQHYNDDHGVIYSPNFPQDYDNNDNCTYTITVLTGKRVELIFFAFRSEACCDTLNVYDGDVPDSRHRLASLSGDNHEGRIFQSSANELTLEFISDITVVNQGFYAKYHTLTGNASTTPPTTTCTNVTLTTHFGFVTSPNWPSDYPNGVTCSSVIDAGYGKTVSFEILDMDIEPCCDFLNIYDGSTTSASAQLASVNGLLQNLKQKKFKSTGRFLTVLFKSDLTNPYQGFIGLHSLVAIKLKKRVE